MKQISTICYALLLSFSVSLADDSALQQQVTGQQQIRDSITRASTQLTSLIAEFERNGITGQEVETLTGIQSILSDLSSKQMAEIIALLDGKNAPTPKIVTAYTEQKAIIVQLRQVVLEYQRQLALDDMARLFQELGDRQSTNLHEVISVLNPSQQRSPSATQKISIQLQASEQASIRDEAANIAKRLEALANSEDNRPQNGIDFLKKQNLNQTLIDAASALETGKLMDAAGNEKSARDTLWQLATLLQPEKTKTDQLTEAAAQIETLIGKEEEIIAATKIDADQQATFDIQKLQGATIDKTDFLQKQLTKTAPEAAEQLENSIASMQAARSELGSSKTVPNKVKAALPNQQEALAKLESARDLVLAELANTQVAEKQVEPPTDQLTELLSKVKELQEKQNAEPQTSLETETRQAQEQATPIAPEAANNLADAAEQMAAASAQIAAGESPELEQQAATDALAQAAENLQEQLKSRQAAQEELAATDKTLDELKQIIEEQQQLQTNTNQPQPENQTLAKQQSDLQRSTKSLGDTSQNESISLASKDQTQASQALEKNQPQAARAPQIAALAKLNAAKDTLEQRRDQLAAELGETPSPEADPSALEQAIADAQAQVIEGLGKLAAQQPTAATTPLAKAADTISPFTAGTEGDLPSGVGEALGNAQQSLAKSIAEASAANTQSATTSAIDAQQALAEASAALALAKAGLNAPAPPPEMASKQPGNKPGEGKQPSQKPGDQPADSNGDEPSWAKRDGDGTRRGVTGTSQFIGLPQRERGAIRQSTADSYPAEYGSMIEQYLKNLSDQPADE